MSTSSLPSRIESSPLYNADLAPATAERRTWGTYNFAALWVSMSVNILTYMLAASLIQGGMNWKQAVATVFLGNTIVLIPMLLNSHPGARYGIPFPVLARASFGVLGANFAAVLRALVACGWFGIQTWIGGEAINTLITTLAPGWAKVGHGAGICFMAFWLINLLVILKGIEYIRFLQGISAPVLLAVGLLLLGWAYKSAGGFGPMLSAPSRFVSFPGLSEIPHPCTEWHGRLLGNGIAEYPRLHALCEKPAPAGHRTSPRPAHDDDTLFADRNPGDFSDGGGLRHRDLESCGTAEPLSFTGGRRDFAAGNLLATLNVNIGANVVSPPTISRTCGRAKSTSAPEAS